MFNKKQVHDEDIKLRKSVLIQKLYTVKKGINQDRH